MSGEDQTFTLAEVRDLYRSAYNDGLAAGYLDGERDGHDRALAEYLAELPDDAFTPRHHWVSADELRDRLNQ